MFELNPPLPQEGSLAPGLEPSVSDLPCMASATRIAPYLQRLCRMRPDTVKAILAEGGESVVQSAIDAARTLDAQTSDADARRILRQAKADVHLALASLDLSCTWDWDKVTEGFSDFADAATEAALRVACWQISQKGWIDYADPTQPMPGIFLLALGKLGAKELNYSSDIDVVAMFDADRLPEGKMSPGEVAPRIIQLMSQILEAPTEHGYVLRVDHRLRPDPRSTPICVSTTSAELYYESVGQNWERMAYIKARPAAGDTEAAEAFLETMVPFVWRRHLDFWALEDIRAIKQQIHSTGGHQGLDNPEFDVKLGRGGIREIEFFAQTQQLIHGGRNPVLRQMRTVDALAMLAQEGHISEETARDLTHIYGLLRGIEHRIQMLNDEHTHSLTAREDQRTRVAALSGYSELARFDAEVSALRIKVHDYYSDLFHETTPLSGVEGNLVFTGVDIDPETVKTLSSLGFSNPEKIISDVQGWHRGNIRATRSARGRQLLTALEPRLFQHMSETGNPDAAYTGLKTFLNGLSAGIQTLSLLATNPVILGDLIDLFSMAPRIARELASRPNLLESLLDGGFTDDLAEDTCGHFGSISSISEDTSLDFEQAMNEVRRNFRDAHFRIRFKLLNDVRIADTAGLRFTELADCCIEALTPVARREVERKLGPPQGRWAICGLGKLGSRDLTANSDVDLMVIYDPDEGAQDAVTFFTRATQRLITAISAQTEEGHLYEADMQLRPSGRAGPVAVRLSAFKDYYRNEAWTWEHMALTRLRVIAGDEALAEAVMAEKEALLTLPRDAEMIRKDALDMRDRLLRDKPAKHEFDVKLTKGGMIDIEFITQVLQLTNPDRDWGSRTVDEVLEKASGYSLLSGDEADTLLSAYRLYRTYLSFQRAALDQSIHVDEWPEALKRITAKALELSDVAAVKAAITSAETSVWQVFCRKLQRETTE